MIHLTGLDGLRYSERWKGRRRVTLFVSSMRCIWYGAIQSMVRSIFGRSLSTVPLPYDTSLPTNIDNRSGQASTLQVNRLKTFHPYIYYRLVDPSASSPTWSDPSIHWLLEGCLSAMTLALSYGRVFWPVWRTWIKSSRSISRTVRYIGTAAPLLGCDSMCKRPCTGLTRQIRRFIVAIQLLSRSKPKDKPSGPVVIWQIIWREWQGVCYPESFLDNPKPANSEDISLLMSRVLAIDSVRIGSYTWSIMDRPSGAWGYTCCNISGNLVENGIWNPYRQITTVHITG